MKPIEKTVLQIVTSDLEVMQSGGVLSGDAAPSTRKCYERLFYRSSPCPGCPAEKVLSTAQEQVYEYQPFPDFPAFLIHLQPLWGEGEGPDAILETVSFSAQQLMQDMKEQQTKQLLTQHEAVLQTLMEKHLLAKALQRNREVQQVFFHLAAHQMQHPIGILRGYIELFLREPKAQYREVIEAELRTVGQMVEKMLRLARADSDAQMPCDDSIEVVGTFQVLLEGHRRKSPEHRFDLHPEQEEGVFIRGNCEDIEEAFRVLLDNFVAYTHPGCRCCVSIRSEGQNIQITVEDDGKGIPEEDKEHLFEPFYRGSHAAGASPGSGLGLALSRKIFELHGGTITLEDADPHGAKFVVTLPILRE